MTAPLRTQQSYRHEAFVWRRHEDYVRSMLPFILDGLDGGEAVMAAVVPEHERWLRQSLGDRAADVEFHDITQLGRNPALIIPAWQQFVARRSGFGRPARGIGEPIWPERSPDELSECQLHEALLNLAVDPDVPFWLVCPYDGDRLDPAVLDEAYRSHPAVFTEHSYQGSPLYVGHTHAHALFTRQLPEIPTKPVQLVADAASTTTVFSLVTLHAVYANLASDKIVDLAGSVRRLVLQSLGRGAQQIAVRLWHQPDELICELADGITTEDYLIGRRAPSSSDEDGLWLANRTCDLVQVRSNESGTTVRLHQRK